MHGKRLREVHQSYKNITTTVQAYKQLETVNNRKYFVCRYGHCIKYQTCSLIQTENMYTNNNYSNREIIEQFLIKIILVPFKSGI